MENIIYTPLTVEELIERVSQSIAMIIKEEEKEQQEKPNEYLTQEEVMGICKVKAKSTLWNWSKQGILVPRASAGRRPLYRYEDVIEFLNCRNRGEQS